MFGDISEIATRLIAHIFSDVCLLLLLLLGIAILAHLWRKPKVQPKAGQPGIEKPGGLQSVNPAGCASTCQDAFLRELPRCVNAKGEPWSHELPDYASIHSVMHSGEHRGFGVADPPEAYFWENEHCSGKFLPLFRPTADPSKDKPGVYPYHDHFKGRKRLWELRMQFNFKKAPEGDGGVRFGVQLPEYVPLGTWPKHCMNVVVAALRRVVGQDLYYSLGDPPKSGQECERPTGTIPLWAFDQFIATPEGEDPPDLHDPHFASFGILRADNRSRFVEEVSQLQMQPGCTYTFSFWGFSQFVDCVRWNVVKVFPVHIDFNTFCKRPPITVSCYSLKKGSTTEKDQRHLESRKHVYFRCEYWSTKKPPSQQQIENLFPTLQLEEHQSNSVQKKRSWTNFLECCSARQ